MQGIQLIFNTQNVAHHSALQSPSCRSAWLTKVGEVPVTAWHTNLSTVDSDGQVR